MGLLRRIQAAMALAFALPPVILGVEALLANRPIGVAWLALAALFLVGTLAIPSPEDVPIGIAERIGGWLLGPSSDSRSDDRENHE